MSVMFISGVCCLIASMPTERARQTRRPGYIYIPWRRRHSTFTSNKYQIHLANNLCRFFYLAAPSSVFYSNAAVIAAARVHGRYSFCIHCFDLAYQSLCISSISPIGLHPQHSGIYTHDSSHTSVYSPLAKAPTHLTSEIGGRYRIVRTPSRLLLSSSRSLGFPSPLLTPLPRPLSLSRNIRSMAELAPELIDRWQKTVRGFLRWFLVVAYSSDLLCGAGMHYAYTFRNQYNIHESNRHISSTKFVFIRKYVAVIPETELWR